MKQGGNQSSTRQPSDDDGAHLTVGEDPSSKTAEERIQRTGGGKAQQSDGPAGNGHRVHDSDSVASFLCPGRMQDTTPNLMSASSALKPPRTSSESPLGHHLYMRTQNEASHDDDRMVTKVDTLMQVLEDVMDILDEDMEDPTSTSIPLRRHRQQ